MGVKKESQGKTTTADRVEFTWTTTISRTIKQIGLAGFAPKPDYAKIKAVMDKEKKPLEWFQTFDNGKCVFTIEATIGGTTIVIGKFDVLAEKDSQKRHDAMQALRDHTSVVTSADLQAFDKKFPPPPDPVKVKKLSDEIKQLLFEIKRDEGFKKTMPTKFKDVDDGLVEIGFKNWAEPLRLYRFADFARGVENGRDAKKLAQEFIVNGSPSFLQIKPATRDAVEASLAAGKVPELKKAAEEVVAIIDATILPRFRKVTIDGIDKRITQERKDLADKQKELKALLGK
ncbi:MAG: hypothetical protein ABJA61_05260 [Caldimonas sp.]